MRNLTHLSRFFVFWYFRRKMDFSQKCQLFRVCANEKCQLKKTRDFEKPLAFLWLLSFFNRSCRLRPCWSNRLWCRLPCCARCQRFPGIRFCIHPVYSSAHFHGIFLWYIQHGSRTCKDMSAIMKTNILNTVVSEQSLESLSDGIGFDRNNVVCLFLVWDCLN